MAGLIVKWNYSNSADWTVTVCHASTHDFFGAALILTDEQKHFCCQQRIVALFSVAQFGLTCHASARCCLWSGTLGMNRSTFVVAKGNRSISGGSVWCCLSRISALWRLSSHQSRQMNVTTALCHQGKNQLFAALSIWWSVLVIAPANSLLGGTLGYWDRQPPVNHWTHAAYLVRREFRIVWD